MNTTPLLVIVGPTASGKTALAIELAKRYRGEPVERFAQDAIRDIPHAQIKVLCQDESMNCLDIALDGVSGGEVISADSRQVYKGFDVTTCKATTEEIQGVPHHLMSFVPLSRTYTVSDFRQDADAAIAAIAERGRLPIVAGGTMFYVKALLYNNVFAEVPPNPVLRDELLKHDAEALFAMLQARDPHRAQTIDPSNKVRLVRALEIVEALGAVPDLPQRTPRYPAVIITLSPPRETLRARIRARVESRLDTMLAEIASARDSLTPDTARRLGFDFTLCLSHVDGNLSREELIDRLTAADWQLAKRQVRWFN